MVSQAWHGTSASTLIDDAGGMTGRFLRVILLWRAQLLGQATGRERGVLVWLGLAGIG